MPVIPNSDPPKHFITEPLRSFSPQKLDNGDIRMAIACAGQHAYSIFGDEATLTEEFLSRDYKTWEGGLVSINHEHNHDWVKATIHDVEYNSQKKLVICSFSGIPEWLSALIYSDDYMGLSQECIPIEFRKNSYDVIKGYGTGVTIVTAPYTPAASPEMGVGIRPELAAILASKYPTNEDLTMTDKTGGGKPAVSVEAFESTVSENVQLKSQIKTLETEKTTLVKELDSWKQKYTDLESGEADRVKIAISEARNSWDAELKAKAEREAAVSELKTVMSSEAYESYLATNPTVEQIKSIAGIMKVNTSKGVGISNNASPDPEGKSYEELNSMWNAKLGRA